MITTVGVHAASGQLSQSPTNEPSPRRNEQWAKELNAAREMGKAEMEAEVEVLRAMVELERNERKEIMEKVTALQKQVFQCMLMRVATESIFSLQTRTNHLPRGRRTDSTPLSVFPLNCSPCPSSLLPSFL